MCYRLLFVVVTLSGLKMPFFYIISYFIYFVKHINLTFGKRERIAVGARSLEKIAYGTRSGDTDFSDHFREKAGSYDLLEVAKKSHIGVLVAGNGHWTAVHSPLDM